MTRANKNVYATTKIDQLEKLISMSIRETLKIKSKPSGVSSSNQLSDLDSYLVEQNRYLEIETLQHFITIINLLKQNTLESTTEIYQGKNIHELVREIEESVSTQGVTRETLLKIAVVYETKKMNPPYYFSWEFMAGTYLPFMSPFIIAVG